MSADIRQFNDARYINLETFKKNGKSVFTPVWFVIENSFIFVVTRAVTGKVKRVRNNPNVRIVPSGFRGEPKGTWIGGIAEILNPADSTRIMHLRNRKYGLQAKLASLLTMRKGKYVVLSIKVI
ncbi:MAG: PPOX class F420-dependent oxidoreductase [Nitrosopumilus sp.]|nr:PPOX class F420-dependent oxidoreductase [Nitrosopumilus sp.]